MLQFDGVNETINKTGSGKSVLCRTTKTLLDRTAHNFTVYANDTVGNMARNGTWFFTIQLPTPGPSSEQTVVGIPSKPTKIINVVEDQAFDISTGDTAIIAVQGKEHDVSLTDVTPYYATLNIMSPLQITLTLGETKDVDVNENGLNDLRIELLQILLPDRATIRLTPLAEKSPVIPTTPTMPTAPASQFGALTAMFTAQQGSFLTFLVLVLVAVIAYVTWGKVKKKKAKKKPSKDEQLKSYIRRERTKMHPEEHIKEQLLKAGWQPEEIDKYL
jgi:hypothetical protein